jgi:hypothetical protein
MRAQWRIPIHPCKFSSIRPTYCSYVVNLCQKMKTKVFEWSISLEIYVQNFHFWYFIIKSIAWVQHYFLGGEIHLKVKVKVKVFI